MRSGEVIVIPNPKRSYLRHDETLTEQTLIPLALRAPQQKLTEKDLGRAIITKQTTGQIFSTPPYVPQERILQSTIVYGHDLLQSLAPLRCNQSGITTLLTEK